jgi:hypothetical protein
MIRNPDKYELPHLKAELVSYLKSERIFVDKDDIVLIAAANDTLNENVNGSYYLDLYLRGIGHHVQIQIFNKDVFAYIQK